VNLANAALVERKPGRSLPVTALIALCLLAASSWWTVRWMMLRWDAPGGYFSHGWLILPVSAFLVIRNRERIASCPLRASTSGLLILIPSIFAHLLASSWHIGFLSGVALIGLVAGTVMTLFGAEMLRLNLFPILFLLFMVPLPELIVEKVSFAMKLAAAQAASQAADLLGVIVVREGSYVRLPTGTLVVDDVCSGLKYLIALTAFGALFAYLSSVSRWRKLVLFVFSIPISFLANVSRIILMIVVAYWWGVDKAEKWYFHDLFGFFLFFSAFVLLFVGESLMLMDFRIRKKLSGPESEASVPLPRGRNGAPAAVASASRRVGPQATALALLSATAGLSIWLSWPGAVDPPRNLLAAVPLSVGTWRGTEYALSERVYQILGTRDVLSRNYSDGNRRSAQLVIVSAQHTRGRTHPPEQCLIGEGRKIQSSGEQVLKLPLAGETKELRVRELVLEGAGGERSIVWYFFKSGDSVTTSYWGHLLNVTFGRMRNVNCGDVLVRADSSGQDDEASRQNLRDFLSTLLPKFYSALP